MSNLGVFRQPRYREDLDMEFEFPEPLTNKLFLKDIIWDLRKSVLPARDKTYSNGKECLLPNHEYMTGGYSSMYMSRNRVRSWDEPSFTIQAGGRHAPLHPQAPKMELVAKDKRQFVPTKEDLYRRLSIRECARVQGFPDEHIFYYKNLTAGYKMVGNAVPSQLAYHLANKIMEDLKYAKNSSVSRRGYYPISLSC